MTIEKNGKQYAVRENKASWTISNAIGRVSVAYNVSKKDYPTFDELKAFVETNELFEVSYAKE